MGRGMQVGDYRTIVRPFVDTKRDRLTLLIEFSDALGEVVFENWKGMRDTPGVTRIQLTDKWVVEVGLTGSSKQLRVGLCTRGIGNRLRLYIDIILSSS